MKSRLLVSIQSPEELDIVCECGVSWIDLKNPNAGSLGKPTKGVLEQVGIKIVQSVNHPQTLPRCFSVALGELLESNGSPIGPDLEPYRFLKIGLSGLGNRTDARTLIQNQVHPIDHPGRWILVYYADREAAQSPCFDSVLEWSQEIGAEFILVDTFVKGSYRLFDLLSARDLEEMVERTHNAGIKISLAGSLTSHDIESHTQLGPDVWAVRSAACAQGNRKRGIDRIRVAHLQSILERDLSDSAFHGVNPMLFASGQGS